MGLWERPTNGRRSRPSARASRRQRPPSRSRPAAPTAPCRSRRLSRPAPPPERRSCRSGLPAAAADAPSFLPPAFPPRCVPAEEAAGGPRSLRLTFLLGERATPARGRWEAPCPPSRGRLSLPELSRFRPRGGDLRQPPRSASITWCWERRGSRPPALEFIPVSALNSGGAGRTPLPAHGGGEAAPSAARPSRWCPPVPHRQPGGRGCGRMRLFLLAATFCGLCLAPGKGLRAHTPKARPPRGALRPAAVPPRGEARSPACSWDGGARVRGVAGSGGSGRSASLGRMYRSCNCAWQNSN